LSYRCDFTFHRIKDYPELHILFDWKVLTSRRDIHPLHIKYNPKLPWNISELTKRTDIDFETIDIISKNRNIDIINFKILEIHKL